MTVGSDKCSTSFHYDFPRKEAKDSMSFPHVKFMIVVKSEAAAWKTGNARNCRGYIFDRLPVVWRCLHASALSSWWILCFEFLHSFPLVLLLVLLPANCEFLSSLLFPLISDLRSATFDNHPQISKKTFSFCCCCCCCCLLVNSPANWLRTQTWFPYLETGDVESESRKHFKIIICWRESEQNRISREHIQEKKKREFLRALAPICPHGQWFRFFLHPSWKPKKTHQICPPFTYSNMLLCFLFCWKTGRWVNWDGTGEGERPEISLYLALQSSSPKYVHTRTQTYKLYTRIRHWVLTYDLFITCRGKSWTDRWDCL